VSASKLCKLTKKKPILVVVVVVVFEYKEEIALWAVNEVDQTEQFQ